MNFNDFFMYLFRRRKGGGALMHVYVLENVVIAFTTEPLDGYLRNLVGMKCSWPRICIEVFQPVDPGQGEMLL